ncbi:F-box only protein 4 [Rhincodon typus]|uniref:F-box only protein 4 n=1 Tax=Rhincodon typus TaxID=259920 RepID=UPI0009A339E9|nr:F-box only protein 4 [Rhincodon typus]
MAGSGDWAHEWSRIESTIRGSFRQLRERYLRRPRARNEEQTLSQGESEQGTGNTLHKLPAEVQMYIMGLLSPRDLCQLGCVSRYWNAMVHDPLLWRYFLLRDLPHWDSVDHLSLPDAALLNKSLTENTEHDYMTVYLTSCPEGRKHRRVSPSAYSSVTSLLYSLVSQTEPRFAMFGPGLEQLDISLVTKMMNSPGMLPVVSLPQRQIDGIGSGITFLFKNEYKFNILTLYSTTWKERESARLEENVAVNRLFVEQRGAEGKQGEAARAAYSIIPQVQNVCSVVNGFIYVTNAEGRRRHEREQEVLQIQAMIDPSLGARSRPLLVLCCISQPGVQRIPCVYVAHQLHLGQLDRAWLAHDTDAFSLNGFLDGIEWILREVGTL